MREVKPCTKDIYIHTTFIYPRVDYFMLIWRGPQLDQQLGANGFVILDFGNQRMSQRLQLWKTK